MTNWYKFKCIDVKLKTELDVIRRYLFLKNSEGIRLKNDVYTIVAEDLQRQNSSNQNLKSNLSLIEYVKRIMVVLCIGTDDC